MAAAQVRTRGWSEPARLVSKAQARALAVEARAYEPHLTWPQEWTRTKREPDFASKPWFKSPHVLSKNFHDLAMSEKILAPVRAVLGDDVMLWGTSYVIRLPGEKHRWHFDLEHLAWDGVSVFLGLEGVRPGQSSLKFIGQSDRIADKINMAECQSDKAAIAHAKKIRPDCTLDYPRMTDGEFVIFSGRTLHGSHNTARHMRTAMLFQYATPAADVRIPLSWNPPIAWSSYRPPCAVASGTCAPFHNPVISPLS